ncbi:MAG: AI-2E family transporter [Absicoccus porci]|uniref:AI-2E family transporter n=1 Tax=Absicoccus porci TaxID=2486576 RepID=UPI0023F3BECD|nr:AI-2E family transporter [Absicoccus porci]MDD6460557.1 AI-2E family transporter [Absicoccus porci]MDD7329771.1 AI-2E family transporter [Absicoccus porci]MDY4738412.1 AI-2E family transporter [Absicoccus porci]
MFHVPKEYQKKASFYQYMIVFAAIVVLLVMYIGSIGHFFAWIISIIFPFILGLGLAFVFNIITNALLNVGNRLFHIKDTKISRRILNIVSILLFVFIILAFFFSIVPQVLGSMENLIDNLPSTLRHVKATALRVTSFSPALQRIIRTIDVESINENNIWNHLAEVSTFVFGDSKMVTQVNNLISTTISWMTTFFLAFVFSIFVLFNKKRFLSDVRRFFKAYLPRNAYEQGNHIYHVFKHTFARYIGGTILECLILGTLVTVFSTIFHLPYSLLCGFVVAIGALVPMFGALVAAILCSLFIMLQSPTQGITFLIMFIAIQQVEGNFIYPNVVGKSVGIPSMYIIVAITVGASIGGVLGMVIFIPLFSSVYRLFQENEDKRLSKKELY